jgi:hypothetical protein
VLALKTLHPFVYYSVLVLIVCGYLCLLMKLLASPLSFEAASSTLLERLATAAKKNQHEFKQELQEERHEQVRQWMYEQAPQALAPLLRQANLTEQRLGQNAVSEQGLSLALQQAEALYQRQQAQAQHPIGYVTLLQVLNQRFAKEEVAALSARFFTYLRSAGESATALEANPFETDFR